MEKSDGATAKVAYAIVDQAGLLLQDGHLKSLFGTQASEERVGCVHWLRRVLMSELAFAAVASATLNANS
jgi:hypothetical protein